MLGNLIQNKRVIIVTVAIITLIALAVTVMQSRIFRVTAVDPADNSTITSLTRTLVLSFNKDLSTFDRTTQLQGGEGIIIGAKVNGSKLYVQLSSMSDGQSYNLVFSGITAVDGSTIDKYSYNFKYKLDPNASSTIEKGSNDPLLSSLPVTTDQYNISYELLDKPTADGKTEKIYITLLIPDSENSDVQKVGSYKKAALSYLSSKGIVLSDYEVEYTPTEAAQY